MVIVLNNCLYSISMQTSKVIHWTTDKHYHCTPKQKTSFKQLDEKCEHQENYNTLLTVGDIKQKFKLNATNVTKMFFKYRAKYSLSENKF